jgi:hypothetical protein
LFVRLSDDEGAKIIFDETTNGPFSTAELWRTAQQSRSVFLGFWLRSLFRKLPAHGLKKSDRVAPLGVVLAFSPRKPEVAAGITEYSLPQARMAASSS